MTDVATPKTTKQPAHKDPCPRGCGFVASGHRLGTVNNSLATHLIVVHAALHMASPQESAE